MLNACPLPAAIGGERREIWLHAAEPAEAFAARVDGVTAGMRIHEGFPGGILELNDVFVVAGESTSCLYDREGFRIAESCVRRGERRDDYIGAGRERITPPTDYATVSTPILYLSMYFRHWGHFLTESTSRLWPRQAQPEFADMEVFFAGFNLGFQRHPNARAFLEGLSAPPRFTAPRGVARITKCFVPAPSFVNRADAHAGHLAAMRDVAATLTRGPRPTRTDQPLYLSRSRLIDVQRVVANERAFDEILTRGGIRVVHPQEMSLREQILLFNTHTTILGCAGSALHNLMFVEDGAETTAHIFSERQLNRNCLLIDAIVGDKSHYACVLNTASNGGSERPGGVIEIDLELATDYLRAAGLLSGRANLPRVV